MDMLFRAYSNPMELVKRYIAQGRFDTFVSGFLSAESEREKKADQKETERMLWDAYIHSDTDMSFGDYKKRMMGTQETETKKKSDAELTEDGIQSILNDLFPA